MDLNKVLKELGKTPEEVAETIRATGFKGQICSGRYCVVAKYLRSLTGHPMVAGAACAFATLSDDRTTDLYPEDRTLYRTPDPVSKFMLAFDKGEYPELIEEKL
jgi:hypothetical protein